MLDPFELIIILGPFMICQIGHEWLNKFLRLATDHRNWNSAIAALSSFAHTNAIYWYEHTFTASMI